MRSLFASLSPRNLVPAFATEAGNHFSVTRIPTRVAAVAAVAVPILAVVMARGTTAEAARSLGDLHPLPLALGGGCLLLGLAAAAGTWRSALSSAGAEIPFREAWGCYGLGSLANAVLPARLGDAVRIGLYASRVQHPQRRRLCAGACLTVAVARAAVWTVTCAAGAAAGLLPVWLVATPLALAGVLGATRLALGRRPGIGASIAASLANSCRPRTLAWAGLGALARVGAAVAVLVALDVRQPVHAAVVGLTALAAAGLVPLGPGGAGAASAGMALALASTGVPTGSAVAAAFSFHAAETLAALAFGGAGYLALHGARAGRRPACPRPESPTSRRARTCIRRRSASG